MVNVDDITRTLADVTDPEMPISIVDLGLVNSVRITDAGDDETGARVTIDILPTFVGCPALDMIRRDIEDTVGRRADVAVVEVTFVYDPPWSVDRITDAGRCELREHGVTVPDRGAARPGETPGGGRPPTVRLRTSAVPCPFCGSSSTYLDSPFGPTRCRAVHYCTACRNSFEHMKRV